MSEVNGKEPRIRDDSRSRTLVLGTKARRALGLPAEAIDWQQLLATAAAEYARGRTEEEIDWEQVVADCALVSRRAAASGATASGATAWFRAALRGVWTSLAVRRLWRPVPLLTGGVLLSLTLHAYRMLAPAPWPAPAPGSRAAARAGEPTLHALTQQGLEAEQAGNPTAAMAAYREALNQVALPLNQLAWLLYQQGRQAERAGNPTAAMAAYREGVPLARLAVEWRPDKAAYLDTLAVLLCQVGEQEEAIRWMEKAAALDPQSFRTKLAEVRRGACP